MRKKPETVKLPKGITQEFMDSLQAMSTDQLKAQIVSLQVQNQENEEFRNTPKFIAEEEALKVAKDRWELTNGPLKDDAVRIKNATKAVVERLKEKGGA